MSRGVLEVIWLNCELSCCFGGHGLSLNCSNLFQKFKHYLHFGFVLDANMFAAIFRIVSVTFPRNYENPDVNAIEADHKQRNNRTFCKRKGDVCWISPKS